MIKTLLLILATSFLPGIALSGDGEQCQADRVRLQMLGTRGPELWNAQASTSYLLWLDNKATVVIDVGPGSAQRFEQSGAQFEDLRVFLFSHFHVDHSADFPAYIKGGFFSDRTKDLMLFGPGGNEYAVSTRQFVNRLFGKESGLYPYLSRYVDRNENSPYKLNATTVETSSNKSDKREIYSDQDLSITAASVHHGAFPALGYRVELAGCVISFTGDMSGRFGAMPDLARNSDILVAHNVIPESATGVVTNLHMKPSYIGKLAAKSNTRQLVLTHLMKRSANRKEETLQLIREYYSGPVSFPEDLDTITP